LPIAADHIGKVIQTAADERVRVRVRDLDGEDGVLIAREASQ
jgi:pyrimidine operon attenuation protein/uracil phosphoribosyltransferase